MVPRILWPGSTELANSESAAVHNINENDFDFSKRDSRETFPTVKVAF
jgi:hypothetical protein